MADSHITADELRRLFIYDPNTGIFTRRITRRAFKAGTIAGTKTKSGYINIIVDGKSHKAHQLAWVYVFGEFPMSSLDHINGVRADNRITNLRKADKKMNGENRKKHNTNNRCGLLGVSRCGNRWKAKISVEGVPIYLGLHKTPEEAHKAYLEAKRSLHGGCTI